MYVPKITDIKILITIDYLNNLKKFPTHEGVLKILKGEVDEETLSLTDCPTFKTLLSLNAKGISRHIMMLLRYDYLKKIYDKVTNELYLSVTDKTKSFLTTFLSKHKINLKKKEKTIKPTIVEIN